MKITISSDEESVNDRVIDSDDYVLFTDHPLSDRAQDQFERDYSDAITEVLFAERNARRKKDGPR